MKKYKVLLFSILALLTLSVPLCAQNLTFYPRTDTFVFDKAGEITSWDGSDSANPPYPYSMGSVNLSSPFPGIDIPFQLGYLNNGFLQPCDPIAWEAKVWVIGDGTHKGDTYTLSGSTACPYFTGEYGASGNSYNIADSFSVVATYVRNFIKTCGHGHCIVLPKDTLSGGTGVAQQKEIE
jgi:hypothetical protein